MMTQITTSPENTQNDKFFNKEKQNKTDLVKVVDKIGQNNNQWRFSNEKI
ncbi:hypothetical protein [Lentibacillus salicampi]|nr:hypothetical protein [Lentibacillus salicampi]